MSSINFLGSYSGIDQTMVDQLMAAEKMPLNSMNTKIQTYTTEKDAWKDINTRLSSLSTKINDLKDEDLFSAKKFTSSVSGIVSASVDNDAIEGSYDIVVSKLAKSTTLVGDRVSSTDGDLNKSGTLNINIDGTSKFSITVVATDSLNDIVTKINESGDNSSVVSASIIDSRLVLKSVEAGNKTISLIDNSNINTIADSLGMSVATQGTVGYNSLIGNQVAESTTEMSQVGQLNINIDGTTKFSINVEVTDSLENIVTKINDDLNNGGSVSASIIDSRLVLKNMGSDGKTISLSDDTGSDSIVDSVGMNIEQNKTDNVSRKGNNSEFTINGISVTDKATNSIDDVVEGLTFNLTSEGTTKLTVSKDYSSIESKIQSVVDQYNSTLTFMQQKSSSGTVGVASSKGSLSGDSALQRLVSNLRTTISDTVSGLTGDVKTASTIGIKTIDNYGTLSFDKTTFESVMASNAEGVKDFFTNTNGFAKKLDSFVDTYIDSTDGLITYKQTSLQSMIDTTNDKIDAFNLRMESREAYYIKIFASLDSYMAKAESTTSWLTSQMGAMNNSSSN
ncbi:flagellar filament capping protein FliD [Clostridium grantii]|uniref:Flagellar hook-associated protein 2 n=1 Tax=Clostridium grantii DSM 8605 TaxID=1121316 RepID=A0A1M5W7N5_9CLOT|nr:flagellar filament capping protein FliD [Clostridium grantii]SHH83471.1 Flagellar capping protein FliD [Clostridium grantii DSM 8605]